MCDCKHTWSQRGCSMLTTTGLPASSSTVPPILIRMEGWAPLQLFLCSCATLSEALQSAIWPWEISSSDVSQNVTLLISPFDVNLSSFACVYALCMGYWEWKNIKETIHIFPTTDYDWVVKWWHSCKVNTHVLKFCVPILKSLIWKNNGWGTYMHVILFAFE